MNISKIFSLFSNNEELDGTPINITSYEDFTATPVFWVAMFRKLINGYKNVGGDFMENIVKDNISLDSDDILKAYEFLTFTRALNYINNINLSEPTHKEALLRYKGELMDIALYESLLFFESIEEYEKCLTLKKIIDFYKSSS
tara:strand:+ start:281 stop:709 length:429 start_codon:yes stop_codon:yes gene_type:complete